MKVGGYMKVTYIDHSGFSLDLGDVIFLFDYVKGELPYFHENKRIYVFSSHNHHDHFSPDIFALASKFSNIKFILSDDITIEKEVFPRYFTEEEIKNKIYFMGKDQSKQIDNLSIRTLGSTDAGVAFIVTYNYKSYYHAGDLNWWHWFGESSQYNENMERDFKKEIDKITDEKFEVAFLPLDPRQEDAYWWGFDYFMRNTNSKTAIPMHLWGKYSLSQKFLKEEVTKSYGSRIKIVLGNNQTFEL